MSTVPEPAAEVAVICVAPSTVKLDAALAPNLTAVAFVKFVPMIVTDVPPEAGPDGGRTAETAGGGEGARYVNWSAALVALVPLGVVTVTSTVPEPAGAVAVICVLLSTLKLDADARPNATAVAPVRLEPVIV